MPNLVRCSHCGEVVQAGSDNCPACGGPMPKLPSYRPEPSASYQEKYKDTEFAVRPETVALPGTGAVKQSWSTLLIGLGVALILVVGAVSGVMILNGSPTPTPREAPVGAKNTSTPAPSLPAVIQNTVSSISAADFSAHIDLSTDYRYNPKNGAVASVPVKASITMSDGNVKGTYMGVEFIMVADKGFEASGGVWHKGFKYGAVLTLVPLLSVTDPKQLQLIGPEMLSGQSVYHLVNTNRWKPITQRISLLPRSPDAAAEQESLELWVAEDGSPVRAKYVGTALGENGSTLMSIQTVYDFTDVGVQVTIEAPKDAK